MRGAVLGIAVGAADAMRCSAGGVLFDLFFEAKCMWQRFT